MSHSALQSNGLYHISNSTLQKLADQLTDSEGNINQSFSDGNEVITFTGDYEIDSYIDDDYYNGTGTHIVTHCSINFDCIIIDEDGNRIATDWSDKDFENYLKN